jgi:STE24 endopeptidase
MAARRPQGERRANATGGFYRSSNGFSGSPDWHDAIVPRPDPLADFSPEEAERARRYHAPLYWSGFADAAIGAALLALLAFSQIGGAVGRAFDGLPWLAATVAWVAVVLAAGFVLRLPLSYWRGFVREHRWGFSTQSVGGWVADRVKSLAVGFGLTSVVLLGFVALGRAFPRAWPLAVAPAGAGLVLVLTFVAPVVLEPVFNRFRPLEDRALADELRAISVQAGVPVRDVLVADASRRTRKENAYVSGLGATRRVVVYDTLLRRADRRQLRLVTAHELGHRRLRHVAAGTALGVGGTVLGVAVLWVLLRDAAILRAVGSSGAGDPHIVPFVLLVVTGLELAGLPFEMAVSRRWERAADRFSLSVTGDVEAFVAAHHDLAVANLIDLDPPRGLYVILFSHPTPPERIAMARAWAADPVQSGARPSHQSVTLGRSGKP